MFNFPFLGFPYNSMYNKYYRPYPYIKKNNRDFCDNQNSHIENAVNKKKTSKYNLNSSINFYGFSDIEKPVLEIMGIKLYLDDIIILGVLFFLYSEVVKDDILFICLIMLLLS